MCPQTAAPVVVSATRAGSSQGSTTKTTKTVKIATTATQQSQQEDVIVRKMQKLERDLAKKEDTARSMLDRGHVEVNGPLPVDFSERFAQAVAHATDCDPNQVKVLSASETNQKGVVELEFQGPAYVIKGVGEQAADPSSKLANGNMRPFLLADDAVVDSSSRAFMAPEEGTEVVATAYNAPRSSPVRDTGIDVDTAMPYGELEPFGREDTAQELTEQSVKESDEMVDQLERAEVAEEKRAVFRALTRLRGAAITSFDGVARAQTGNIDEYNKIHKWRRTHPLHHLADEESDITKWAFPNDADF